MLVSVLIPSRLAPHPQPKQGGLWLDRALASITAQKLSDEVSVEIVVGLDPGNELPDRFQGGCAAARANTAGQAAAVNAAAAAAQGDVIAILEDDDAWTPTRLQHGLTACETFRFVSSNQLLVDTQDNSLEHFDFPTPSGWLMKRDLWDELGGLDESLKWHVDNEWLGRLNASGTPRCHLVDANFPPSLSSFPMQRPWLANMIAQAPQGSIIRRHTEDNPLVIRTVNPDGGMGQIERGGKAAEISEREYRLIVERFGYIPC